MAVGDTRAGEAGNPLTATENNITVNKYVSENATGGYSLTLEAYAANQQTTTTTTTPLDIVLVLDVSGSMAYNFNGRQENDPEKQRITALKTAVNSFIDSVASNAASSGANHQISIVKFAGNWSDDIGNDTYDSGRDTYNCSQVVASLTSVSSGAEALKGEVNDLTASGATRADFGMKHAQSVLNSSQRESKKVVIMFTDGQPTSGSSYEGAVAHGAINTAKVLKDEGVTVYTIGIFGGADPSNTSEETNKYMNAVSSKYPNAVSEERWLFITYYEVELGSPVDGSYYFASSSAEGLEDVFRTIANTVTSNTLTANPDSEAVLSDTLSEYFNFPEGLTGQNPSGVTVEKVPVTGKAGDSYSWGSPVDITGEVSVTVSGDSISITGFDYKANAVTESTEGGETTYRGYKLVVTFPIEVDMAACVSDPQENHSYPTNNVIGSKAGLFYKSENAESNDTYTTLSASPTVTIDELNANGTDVTVQVYVDGALVTDPLDYITLGRSTKDTAYSYFKTTVGPDGTVSCDFNYSPTGGNHDCVDLEVTVNSSAYVLNGVNSYQSHGMNGTNNVTPSGSAYAYIVDNVTADNTDAVDCTIYLRSAYSVEYYQGGKLTEEPYNDQNTYVVEADVAASTAQEDYPAEGSSARMSWKNDEALTSISLPALPSVTGSDVDGWFLGSEDGTKYEPKSESNVSAVKPDTGSVIKFYATSSTSRYTITINYVDDGSDPLKTAYTDTQDYNYKYSFDVSEEDEAVIPFIIVKGDTNYVFDHFADSTPLSGELTDDVVITAVYLIDENKNGTPDAYEATVTYEVENGTWADGTADDQTTDFILREFNDSTNSWVDVDPTPTLGITIPTGMKPVTGYANIGSWSPSATADTPVTGNAIYTYTFGTRMYTITINYVDDGSDPLKTAYTDTQNNGYKYSFDVSEDDTGTIPFIIVKDDTNYVFDHFADSTPLSGELTDDVVITAVYLIDANGNEVPDAYDASVTYEVVNGTWAEGGSEPKTEDFTLKKFNASTNTWVDVDPTPTLGNTIPTDMKPDTGYADNGAWGTDISDSTPVTGDVTYTYTFGTRMYSITINYQDDVNTVLKTAYTDTQNDGSEYSFDVSTDTTGEIPLIIVKEGTNYVFDHFADGSDPLSGTLTGDVEITAVYLIDENGNEVPDAYEATVTYKVVNGTWADDTNADKTEDFVLKTFDPDTNTWVAATPTPTLGITIPTGMKPVTGYANIGSWSPSATADTPVTGNAIYTYTFGTRMYTITINYQDEDGAELKTVYTDTQNDGYEYRFDVSADASGYIPFIIVKEGTNYVFDHFADDTPLSGKLTDDVVITAVYLIDANGNKVPDAYEATVTYKVVNGTWANDTTDDQTTDFILREFNDSTNSWVDVDPTPTLGNTIPTGMKPDANHTGSGEWDTAISADTKVTGDVTYTYTFSTEKAPALTVDKTVTSVGGTEVSDQSSIPSATVGDVIEYQIAVENTGNVALSDVTVSDGKWASGVEITVDGAASTLTGDSYTITSLDVGKSVTITYSYTVTDADVTAGKVTNNVTADDGNDTEDDDIAEVPVSGTITITPANITIYMGGDEGYDAVVGENAQTTSSNSMPTPLFYVTVPSSLGNVNVSDIVLTGAENRKWEFELAGYDSTGKALYYINSTGFTGQDDVRVTYTGIDGKAHISDSFNPSTVHELFTTYDIAIYPGNAGKVEATVNGVKYGIASGTGKLYVRAVEDTEDNPVVSVETTVTEPVASGEAAIFAPADTKYTLNNTSVEVDPEGVGLLFDSIIDTDADRTGALIDAIESEYNINITNGNYQAQYLDLVDANNGNAWVKADGNVTVYWGYPKGTNSSTSFTLYHFTDLHRDGSNSGFDIADISNSDIEVVKVTKTTYGIAFEVEPGGFSPFVLVWSDNYIPPIVPPSEPDYTPNWLNTTDHFGYIIGYEDGTVKPNAGITRAEVATIFFRLLTDEARERFWSETNAYTDVADGSWYNNAISTLSNIGILGGYEDGTFRPNASITRAEFAKIAVSFFDWADIEAANNFVDVRDSAWYANYVAVAAKIGLIEGYGGNVFRPDATITRAEACTIINRTLGRAPDADHLLPVGQMNTWPDNADTGVWYYAQIQEATNSHDYRWIGDIEQWTAKLPEPDWDKLQY